MEGRRGNFCFFFSVPNQVLDLKKKYKPTPAMTRSATTSSTTIRMITHVSKPLLDCEKGQKNNSVSHIYADSAFHICAGWFFFSIFTRKRA